MKNAHVCFLWHMHQPYYTDPSTGTVSMPWVRLHATKAYFDMAWMLERFPSVKSTVNFTPSLLRQLQEMLTGSVHDLFLDHAERPADELNPAERSFLVRYFFSANWATMVRPYPRYHELLAKRGADVSPAQIAEIARRFSTQELLDLQTWHNLAWFGFGAVAEFPRLAELRKKGRAFTEQEKREVLDLQREVMARVVPRYRALADRGQVELTTTPYFHPILPLVIDTDISRRARPDLPVPPRFQAPPDAAAQLKMAVRAHTETFGRAPAGLWPSEGSVCPELVPLVHGAGFTWMATDEGVLARSMEAWDRTHALYRPYVVGEDGREIRMVFRDRELSDVIGFNYSKSVPESAVDDLTRRIAGIVERSPHDELVIPIILDGENPWEHYHDGGEAFLRGLYTRLTQGPWGIAGARIGAETVSAAIRHVPAGRLSHLHSGSWINSDFKIWLGHHEDNRGWSLLRDARERLVELTAGWPPEVAAPAWDALYAAEGSDWFWWYGDDFETDFKQEFDRLFRTHLRNVYLRAGAVPPPVLDEPVAQGGPVVERIRLPVTLLSPTIDGRVSNFFEWRGAGEIDPSPPLGAMWKSAGVLRAIGFAYSVDALFLRLDVNQGTLTAGMEAELHLSGPAARHRVRFSLVTPQEFIVWRSAGGEPETEVGRYATIARRDILELAVAFKTLSLHAGDEFKLTLVLLQNGLEADRYPKHRPVALTVPDEHYEATMWRV